MRRCLLTVLGCSFLLLCCKPDPRVEAGKLFGEKRYTAAAAAYKPLASADGAPLEVRRNYALSLAWAGKAKEAEPLLGGLVEESPDADLMSAYIDAEALTSGPEQAEAIAQKALEQFPQSATIHRAFGTLAAQKGDIPTAKAHLDRALALDPELAAAHANMGDISLLEGNVAEAIERYQRALLLEPVSPMSVRIRVRMARVIGQTNPDEARFLLEEARMIDPSAPDVLAELGKANAMGGDYAQCIQLLKDALDAGVDRPDVFSTLGFCFMQRSGYASGAGARRQDLLAARMWFQRLLEKEPAYKGANNNLGQVLAQLGEGDAAEEAFSKELKLYPNSVEALMNLGRVRAEQGKMDEARAFLERAFNIDQSEVVLATELGRLAFLQSDWPEALKWYQTAYTLCQETLLYHPCRQNVPYQLARLAGRSRNKEAAVKFFLQAVDAGFNDFGRFRAESELRFIQSDPRVTPILNGALSE